MPKIPGRPQKAADDWLDAFRTQARASNTAILAVTLSLVLAWFTVIEPTYQEFETVVHDNEATTDTRLEQYRKSLVAIVLRRVKDENQPVVETPTSPPDGPEADPGDGDEPKPGASVIDGGTVAFLLNARDEEMRAYDRLSSQIAASAELEAKLRQNAVFELLGSKFPIPKTLVVLSWIAVLAGLLAYVSMRRNTLASTLLKAKREYESAAVASLPPPAPPVAFVDFAGEAPFWLSPIASLRPSIGNGGDVMEALGWGREDERNSRIIAYAALFVLALILTRVAWIGFMLTDDYKPAADAAGFPLIFGVRLLPLFSDIAVSALIVVVAGLMLRYVVPAGVANAAFNLDRRGAARTIGLGVLATFGTFLIGSDAANWKFTHTRDRYKRRNKDPEPWQALAAAAGFYRFVQPPGAVDTQPALYVSSAASTWAPERSDKKPMLPVALGQLIDELAATAGPSAKGHVLRGRHWSSSVELAALDLVEASKDQAISLLQAATTFDLKRTTWVGALGVPLVGERQAPALLAPTPPPLPAVEQLPQDNDQAMQAALTRVIDSAASRRLTGILIASMQRSDRPVRLYDLLALLLATNDDQFESLSAFSDNILTNTRPLESLRNRAEKWKHADSAWRKRILDTKRPLKWSCPTPKDLKVVTIRA